MRETRVAKNDRPGKSMNLLDRIGFSFRCPMDWEAMEGDEQSRFCLRCRKMVHDLSALSAEEAESFLRENPGACVRILRRADGSVVTRGCPREQAKLRKAALTTAVAAGTAAVAACSATGGEEPHEQGLTPLLGVTICPEDLK